MWCRTSQLPIVQVYHYEVASKEFFSARAPNTPGEKPLPRLSQAKVHRRVQLEAYSSSLGPGESVIGVRTFRCLPSILPWEKALRSTRALLVRLASRG